MYRGATAPRPPPTRVAIAGQVVAPSADTTGLAIFENEGCSACHAIAGKGGGAAPDLTRVGARRDAQWLRRFIANPAALDLTAVMPPFDRLPEATLNRPVAYLASLR